jgi:hypothetical protein
VTAPRAANPIARVAGTIGIWLVALIVYVFGRTYRRRDVPWLSGPIGGDVIGDAPYAEVAAREHLTIDRTAQEPGLVQNFGDFRSESFDPSQVHQNVRDFYEHTAAYTMDVWSKTYFPSNLGLALLVKTISRQMNQLNFPLSPLEMAHGISSDVIPLRDRDGEVRYTGWFRKLGSSGRVLYAGFYMGGRAPHAGGPCEKVVFPLPNGNATVFLRPENGPGGAFILDSHGKRFGDVGYYRLYSRDDPNAADGRVRVWRIRTLHERFVLRADESGAVRCDHTVRFLFLPALSLHYKIYRRV